MPQSEWLVPSHYEKPYWERLAKVNRTNPWKNLALDKATKPSRLPAILVELLGSMHSQRKGLLHPTELHLP
jgi:hypothetical protein